MFCTSLRRRASFASVVPALISTPGLSLKESQLDTHDIALKLPRRDKPVTSTLCFLLLSPTSVLSDLDATLTRIEHFASLTGGLNIAMVLLLSSPSRSSSSSSSSTTHTPAATATDPHPAEPDPLLGQHSYAQLQATLLSRPDLPWIPILPLARVAGLPSLLQSYAGSVGRGPPAPPEPGARSLDLLAQCTVEAPLSPLARDLASDVFRSLAELAGAATAVVAAAAVEGGREIGGWASPSFSVPSDRTRGARKAFEVLREQVGDEVVEGMLEFWAGEWIAD
ncbi:hypothetical protein MBLNU459_g7409t2 [Dothideomycetes sp. NU459]